MSKFNEDQIFPPERKLFEYQTVDCDPEELFQVLNDNGAFGWDFCILLTKQMMVQPKILGNSQPQILTQYVLIFKREKQ